MVVPGCLVYIWLELPSTISELRILAFDSVTVFINFSVAQESIQEVIPPAYVTCRVGTTTVVGS